MENKIDFSLEKAFYVAEEFGDSLWQTILVPQEKFAFNKKGEVSKDAHYKAFRLYNGRLDTEYGIQTVRYKYDLEQTIDGCTWSKFIPIGYGQLLLDEAEAKIKAVKFLKVKKLNELLDEALDAPAV